MTAKPLPVRTRYAPPLRGQKAKSGVGEGFFCVVLLVALFLISMALWFVIGKFLI